MKHIVTTTSRSQSIFYSAIQLLKAASTEFLFSLSQGKNYKFRKVTEKDSNEVKSLIQKILLERGGIGIESLYYDRELDHLTEIYNSKGHLFKVLTCNKEIVGTVGLGPLKDQANKDEKICEIRKLYLHRDFRNKGQGKKMFENAVLQAKRMGYEKCMVAFENRNTQFYHFLISNGFKMTGGSIGPDATHEVKMLKNLS